jgi:hypothetical protein
MDKFIKNGLTVGSQQTIRNLWQTRANGNNREIIRDNVQQLKRLKLK